MPEDGGPLLLVDSITAGYGKRQVLDAVTMEVARGEIVALIGHNGAGKSTLLKAVFGMLPIWAGGITLGGSSVDTPNPRDLLRAGVAYLPQGNRVFGELSVMENLEVGRAVLSDSRQLMKGVERILTLFPALKSRLRQRAGTLSGGEKQMLALANVLVLAPRLLLLDEPSSGLAPPLVTDALRRIQQISQDSGASVLIIEQKVREVLKITNRVYVLRNGQVSFSGVAGSLADEVKLREVYL